MRSIKVCLCVRPRRLVSRCVAALLGAVIVWAVIIHLHNGTVLPKEEEDSACSDCIRHVTIYDDTLRLVARRHVLFRSVADVAEGEDGWVGSQTVTMWSEDPTIPHTYSYGPTPPHECGSLWYGDLKLLPRASVILSFHENELLADVLHTIHSIVQRTPGTLLHEVILIDDHSTKEDFQTVFENYLGNTFAVSITIIRCRQKLGLIKGRLLGARVAKGDVLVMLDSHMEVQAGWLEPVLWQITRQPNTLATFVLDFLLGKTGEHTYKHGGADWLMVFDWSLLFGWSRRLDESPSRNCTHPIETPVTVGHVAISRQYFFSIGGLDGGMEGWGGENIDLAIRVWLMGGRVVVVPCSVITHLERPGLRMYRYRPGTNYSAMADRNYRRLVDVWFDDHQKDVLFTLPRLKNTQPGDLSERFALKRKAVHNFTWYLTNVLPELMPLDKEGLAWGYTYTWRPDGRVYNQLLLLTAASLTHSHGNTPYTISALGDPHPRARWLHWRDGPLILLPLIQCLEAPTTIGQQLRLVNCNWHRLQQRWEFSYYTNLYGSMDTYTIARRQQQQEEDDYSITLGHVLRLVSEKKFQTLHRFLGDLKKM